MARSTSPQGPPPLSMESLVDCMNQMGCLPEFKESLRRGLASNVKTVIMAVMQNVKNEERTKQDQGTFGHQQPAKLGMNLSIPPAVAGVTERVLSDLCKRVQVILYNLLGVLKIISLKDKNSNTSEASLYVLVSVFMFCPGDVFEAVLYAEQCGEWFTACGIDIDAVPEG